MRGDSSCAQKRGATVWREIGVHRSCSHYGCIALAQTSRFCFTQTLLATGGTRNKKWERNEPGKGICLWSPLPRTYLPPTVFRSTRAQRSTERASRALRRQRFALPKGSAAHQGRLRRPQQAPSAPFSGALRAPAALRVALRAPSAPLIGALRAP